MRGEAALLEVFQICIARFTDETLGYKTRF